VSAGPREFSVSRWRPIIEVFVVDVVVLPGADDLDETTG
jgi:hypothetical protein